MNKLKLITLLICCFISFSFQDSTENKSKAEQIRTLLVQAENSVDMMEFDKAQKQLNKSLKFATEIDHERYIALTSGILARMYHIRHEYDKAITELERAISTQREIDDQPGLAYSYILYAKILSAKNEIDRALKYLD